MNMTECMTNMLNCDKVYEMFAHPPDAKDAGKKKVKKEKKDGKKGTEVAGKKAKAVIKGMCWARLKLWILLSGCAHEDYETARAASGGLAILSDSEDVCNRVLEEKQGMKILRENTVCGKCLCSIPQGVASRGPLHDIRSTWAALHVGCCRVCAAHGSLHSMRVLRFCFSADVFANSI